MTSSIICEKFGKKNLILTPFFNLFNLKLNINKKGVKIKFFLPNFSHIIELVILKKMALTEFP